MTQNFLVPPQGDRNVDLTYITVQIFHKQRGGKGVWQHIEPGERIRVTKHIGKRVKMTVSTSFPFTQEDVNVKLLDLVKPDKSEDMSRFSVESVFFNKNQMHGRDADYEMKIFTLSKKLQFSVSITTELGSFQQSSSIFGSHNSGKHRLGKRENFDLQPPKVLVAFFPNNKQPLSESVENLPQNPYYSPPKMEYQPKRTDFSPVKRPREENPNFYPEQKISRYQNGIFEDMRMYIPVDVLIKMLRVCCKKNGELVTWDSEARIAITFIGEELRKVFPATVKINDFGCSTFYQNLVPVILFNINLEVQMLSSELELLESIYTLDYSNPHLKEIAINEYTSIKRKITNDLTYNKSYTNSLDPPQKSQEPNQRISDLEEMKTFLDRYILPNATQTRKIALGIFAESTVYHGEEIYIAIYQGQDLLTQKTLHLQEFCYIFVDSDELGQYYNSRYTLSLFSKNSVPKLQGFVSLYDLRKTPEQTIIVLNPIELSGSKGLAVLGSFDITNNQTKWSSNERFNI